MHSLDCYYCQTRGRPKCPVHRPITVKLCDHAGGPCAACGTG